MTDVSIVTIGLPASGKTTFFAALWGSVLAPGGRELRCEQVTDADRSYLSEIADRLSQLEVVGRTDASRTERISLQLASSTGSFLLNVPDLSGEAFERPLKDAVWPAALATDVAAAAGMLLFIGRDVRQPMRIDVANAVADALGPEANVNEPSGADDDGVVGWSPALAPTQVKLVELLQHVEDLRDSRPIRVAVIISAWDKAAPTETPTEWLKQQLPLLHQFLDGRDTLPFRVFGVSAQGGAFPEKVSALEHLALEDRVLVHDGESQTKDITLPVAWLLSHQVHDEG